MVSIFCCVRSRFLARRTTQAPSAVPTAQPFPTLISTDWSERAELSTKVITVDGSPVTILEQTYVVAPNPVLWHGRTLKTKQDWIKALEELGTEQKWPPVGTAVNQTKLLQKMSHSNPSHPNQTRSNARGSGNRVNIYKVQNQLSPHNLTTLVKRNSKRLRSSYSMALEEDKDPNRESDLLRSLLTLATNSEEL